MNERNYKNERNLKKRTKQIRKKHVKELEELVFGKNILEDLSHKSKKIKKEQKILESVWNDNEDSLFDLNKTDRLKKFKKLTKNGQTKISTSTYEKLSKERYQPKKVAWAEVYEEDEEDITTNNEENDENNELALLRNSESFVSNNSKSINQSRLGKILVIKRQIDANVNNPSEQPLNTVKFHSNSSLLLVGGEDRVLNFFHIDGEKNESQLSVRFNDMTIKYADFIGDPSSGEVIVGGRRPYFYSYDIVAARSTKIPSISREYIRSHELMSISPPDSTSSSTSRVSPRGYIAISGSSGNVHIISSKFKTSITNLKLTSDQHVKSLCWWNDQVVCASGGAGTVCLWDLRMSGSAGGRVLWSFRQEDGTDTSCISTNRYCISNQLTQKYLAVGAESGVVSIYDLTQPPLTQNPSIPFKLHDVMNLTTSITSMAMHPSGKLLAIGSVEQTDQLRMVQLPNCTVYNNWPTSKTPLGKVRCIDFSSDGKYFVQGDHRGQAHLYLLD